MTEGNKSLVKAAIAAGEKELAIEECGLSVKVIVDGRIKLPCNNEDIRKSCKPLYMAACNIRDGKAKTWEGISIPPMYWPSEGQKRGEGTTSTPSKPLFKVAVGSIVKEFDKSDPNVIENVLRWVRTVTETKVTEYNNTLLDTERNKEYVALLSDIKPIAALQLEDTVKVSMITPLLASKGYKQVESLACNLLSVACKVEGVSKDFTLLEKVEG